MASSNAMYPLEIIISTTNEFIDENIALAQYSLISVRTICPAVMLAASRKDSVIGRTSTLVVSIITRNGFNHSGAPSGRKWAIDFFGLHIIEDIIILIHIGRPMDKVKIKCLEVDSEYGINPIKLIMMIIMNRDVTIDEIPFKLVDMVRESCIIIVFIIGLYVDSFRFMGFHICDCIIIIGTIFNITVIDDDGISNENFAGSKIEKMSLIIKIWFVTNLSFEGF